MKKVALLLLITVMIAGAGAAFAETLTLPNPLCLGGAGSPGCINDFQTLVARVTDFVLTVIEALAVLVFVWAGILYLTSAGNPGQVEKAKNALKYAVIGIVVALVGKGLIGVIQALITPPTP